MARSPDVLQDTTPLDAAQVDVPVRVAWLLRISRAVGGRDGHLSVTEMAARLKERGIAASAPSVSGWETGRVAPGPAVLEAYEAVLGRDPGTLRGAVDMTWRTFRQGRSRAGSPTPDLARLDALWDRVGSPDAAGIDWLHFCEAALSVRPGLPRSVLLPLVRRLLSELSRAVFTGYVTRYEGLAMLRCGQYADLVLEAVREHIDEPGAQVVADVFSLVAERPDPDALRLISGYLADESPIRTRGAVLGLENALSVAVPRAELEVAAQGLGEALRRHGDDPERRPLLHGFWRLLPASLHDEVRRTATGPDPAPDDPAPDERQRRSAIEMSKEVVARVCDRAGVRHEPLMARLLYEAAFDRRHTRSFTSMLLLMASPLRGLLAEELAAVGDEAPAPGAGRDDDHWVVREEATDLLVGLGHHESARRASTWLDSDDDDRVSRALVTLAHAAHDLPEARLADLLNRPGVVGRRALYHAGMTGHEMLDTLAEKESHPLALGARWWLRHGAVVER